MKSNKKIYGIALALMCSLAATLKAQYIYVSYGNDPQGIGIIGQFGLDGSTVNASLISDNQPPAGNPEGLAVSGTNLFVTSYFLPASVGEYGLDGSTVNESLISGLSDPAAIAISGTNLFVASGGTIGKYGLDGSTVNASLISGLNYPWGLAISGTNLYVASFGPVDLHNTGGTIGVYGLDGSTVNASLISGLNRPEGLAISGTNLFVANYSAPSTIGEYTTAGATVNASLITEPIGTYPVGLAISGTNLFVANENNGTISEYTIAGVPVNASLISGLDEIFGIAIIPEPGSCGGTPALYVRSLGNTVIIYWQAVPCWNLQQNTNLGTANWVSSGFSFTTSNGTNYVSIVSPSGNLFFRLQGP